MATLIAAVNARQALADTRFVSNAYYCGVDAINIHLNNGDENIILKNLMDVVSETRVHDLALWGTPHNENFVDDLAYLNADKLCIYTSFDLEVIKKVAKSGLPASLLSSSLTTMSGIDAAISLLRPQDELPSDIALFHTLYLSDTGQVNIKRVRELGSHFQPLRTGISCPPFHIPILASSVLYGAEYVEADLRGSHIDYDMIEKLSRLRLLINDFEKAMQGEVT